MKKTVIFLFGLIIITTSIFPAGLKVSFTPMDIVAATAITSVKSFKKVPVYVPGSMKLLPTEQLKAELWPVLLPGEEEPDIPLDFRYCYYHSYATLWTLAVDVDPDEYYEWLTTLPRAEDFYPNGTAEEMPLVTLVKHFKVPKCVFVAEVERQKEGRAALGEDMSAELNEFPNADIIYTFDNKLINYYYRRA